MVDTTYLDSYCERLGQTELWAEPFNAVSNIAFLLAAILTYRYIRNHSTWDIWLLSGLLFVIGLGSGAWHIYPNSTTLMLDVLPILLFINMYLIVFLLRVYRWPWYAAIGAMGVLQALNAATSHIFPPDTLHGTIFYLPTWLMLVCITVYARFYHRSIYVILGRICLIWTASLTLRTLDMPLCHVHTIGTHYWWHLLNSVVLYQLLSIVIRQNQSTNLHPVNTGVK